MEHRPPRSWSPSLPFLGTQEPGGVQPGLQGSLWWPWWGQHWRGPHGPQGQGEAEGPWRWAQVEMAAPCLLSARR